MMSHRYALAAVMLAAFALPAAAQQTTTPPDTSKKTTTTTSNGAVSDTAAAKTEVAPSTGAIPAMGAPKTEAPAAGVSAAPTPEGQVTPHAAAKVDVKVAPSLANTVKISGDSAFAIVRSSPDAGEISSADLEMKAGRLVYEVKTVKGAQGASEVVVDAMTGEILKDKKYGGLKALDTHAKEEQKLQNAKADSANTKKP